MIWYNSRVVTEITFSTKIFRANSLRREGHTQPQEKKKKKKKKKKSARHRVEPSATSSWRRLTSSTAPTNHFTYFQVLFPLIAHAWKCCCFHPFPEIIRDLSALQTKFARSKFCSMKLSLTPSLLWLVTMSLFFLQRQLFITPVGLESLLPSKI